MPAAVSPAMNCGSSRQYSGAAAQPTAGTAARDERHCARACPLALIRLSLVLATLSAPCVRGNDLTTLAASSSQHDCAARVPNPVDVSPVRTPQAVHSVIAAHTAGKVLVEIGTRNGDGLACWSQLTVSAYAIEMERPYCTRLLQRVACGSGCDAGKFDVLCGKFQDVDIPTQADVFTWWMGEDSLDHSILARLSSLQLAGRIGSSASVILPLELRVDLPGVERWLALLRRHMSWVVRVDYDEKADCESRIHILKPARRGDDGRLRKFSPHLCPRARGAFAVAAAPIHKWRSWWPAWQLMYACIDRNVKSLPPSCNVLQSADRPVSAISAHLFKRLNESGSPSTRFKPTPDVGSSGTHYDVVVIGAGPNSLRMLACL